MDKRYELFCLADPLFYDSPNRSGAADRCFAAATRPLPAGWAQTRLGEWQVQMPPGDPLPAQGWKIHVSACTENAERVLGRLFDYCVPRQLSFKFLRSPLALHLRNAKYAPRGASGKLVTIYPADEAACERILAELNDLVGGEPGPYILSDLRYGDGPLYVRYGGFTERYCLDAGGELVPAIETTRPAGPRRAGAGLHDAGLGHAAGFPGAASCGAQRGDPQGPALQIDEALHFSNGGGVYAGTDSRTGERVVLKEARPHAGLAADGCDAVARLRREHDILGRLSGLDVVPDVRGYFPVGEHHFLVEDISTACRSTPLFAERYPLIGAAPDPAAIADYTSWALRICAGLERAVGAMHERGIVFNDLHMFNIMVRPGRHASPSSTSRPPRDSARDEPAPSATPGSSRPGTGPDSTSTRYSLACLRLAMFLPLTTLFALDRGKAAQLANGDRGALPGPAAVPGRGGAGDRRGAAAPGRTAIGPRHRQAGPGHRRARPRHREAGPGPGRLRLTSPDGREPGTPWCSAIHGSATPARDDRLFPGDIEQFAAPSGGLGIAHGAAGVLYALSEAGRATCPNTMNGSSGGPQNQCPGLASACTTA